MIIAVTVIQADRNPAVAAGPLGISNLDAYDEPDTRSSVSSENSISIAGCPEYALFAQQYHMPSDTLWRASTSDANTPGSIRVFDNFADAGSINRLCFWGLNGYYTDNWFICFESPMMFDIRFYSDNNGVPGSEVASYLVTCTGNRTGLIYGGAFELYEYYADLPQPVDLLDGWISIQGLGNMSDCWFVWMSAAQGLDETSYQWDGHALVTSNRDRAFCLQHQTYICGDIDGDGTIGLYDVIHYIYYKYKGGEPPISTLTSDVNGDGSYNILDILYLLNFLYKNGPVPNCQY